MNEATLDQRNTDNPTNWVPFYSFLIGMLLTFLILAGQAWYLDCALYDKGFEATLLIGGVIGRVCARILFRK